MINLLRAAASLLCTVVAAPAMAQDLGKGIEAAIPSGQLSAHITRQ